MAAFETSTVDLRSAAAERTPIFGRAVLGEQPMERAVFDEDSPFQGDTR